MHVLISPHEFKGSLTATQVASALPDGITVAAAVEAGWTRIGVRVQGPTGAERVAEYAVNGDRAVLELAGAVGLAAVPAARPDLLGASTFGLGTLIAHALDRGVREVIVGLGGSASIDGGAGMLQALGARILDHDGRDIEPGGVSLLRASDLRLDRLHPRLRDARIVIAPDVDNPLLGSEGAGAAGGTGFGLMAVLGATPRSGIDVVLELVDLSRHLADADLVITGEGPLDEQTLHGKAPMGVANAAQAQGVPVHAVAGQNFLTAEELRTAGIDRAFALTDVETNLDRCRTDANRLVAGLANRIVRARREDSDPRRSTRRNPFSGRRHRS